MFITHFYDIPMVYINYLAMHNLKLHDCAKSKLFSGFLSVRVIIHPLNLEDYLRIQTHTPNNNVYLYQEYLPCFFTPREYCVGDTREI